MKPIDVIWKIAEVIFCCPTKNVCNLLQLLHKDYSFTYICHCLEPLIHVLIYKASWTEAMWCKQNCPSFEMAQHDSKPGSLNGSNICAVSQVWCIQNLSGELNHKLCILFSAAIFQIYYTLLKCLSFYSDCIIENLEQLLTITGRVCFVEAYYDNIWIKCTQYSLFAVFRKQLLYLQLLRQWTFDVKNGNPSYF